MAAYAALVSLMSVIDNLENHPRPPISLHKNQVHLLTQNITFLQEFLEAYNPNLGYSTEADPLESRIADVAHAAEDIIETHIVDHIIDDEKKLSSDGVYQALEKAIEEMVLIEKEAVEIKQTVGVNHQLHTTSTPPDSSISSSSSMAQMQQIRMVGADKVLRNMQDMLASDLRRLQVISIVGMGGSGKTTLATNIYQDRLISEKFHICAWVTISQEYSIQGILEQLLKQLGQQVGQPLSQGELGDMLHKHLFGRKYLIVLDDMWTIGAWEGIRMFLPNNINGSRIVVTTRLSSLASKLPNSISLEMNLLDEANSWVLLSETVFGGKACPLEFEEIGKKIAKSCKGLPLSIVVVGGLLAKSEHTIEFWEYVEANLNSIVNSEDGEWCLKILYMSYKQLPIYLKPCFLYMGVFDEDVVIWTPRLIRLWVGEGFVKPIIGKSLEEIAKEYLKDLADRNLILIHELGRTGNIKECKIHDLLRDLCLREAEKERFYTTNPQRIVSGQRRVVISENASSDTLQSISLARSVMWYPSQCEIPALFNFRLLRLLEQCGGRYKLSSADCDELLENMRQLVNSRFIKFQGSSGSLLPDSIWRFWNLQTLIVDWMTADAPSDIWYLPHIRHIQFNSGLRLPDDPPNGQHDSIVLGNLRRLGDLLNFKCSDFVVKRIRNIEKLVVDYSDCINNNVDVEDEYCLRNLACLDKLESLRCFAERVINGSLINFPNSLKKLFLEISSSEYWEDILDKIGALPHLQRLDLSYGRFKEGKWETTEGQFRSLKILSFCGCEGLQVWTAESSHFPRLEQLHLILLETLEEIPFDFAEMSTLKLLRVMCCSDSAVISAKRILEEQEELYGEEAALRVEAKIEKKNEVLESLASPNFLVELQRDFSKEE